LKGLIILTTLMISSGCVSNNVIEPLCLPNRPTLEPITTVEQMLINAQTLRKIADNDLKLKSYVRTAERLAEEHNKQFKAKCL